MTIFPRLNHALVAVGAILFLLPFSATFAASQGQQPETTSTSASQRSIGQPTKQLPKHIPGGFDLPNGWRITPAGKAIATIEDLVLNLVVSPDGRE